MIKLELGRQYKTRNGEIVTITSMYSDGAIGYIDSKDYFTDSDRLTRPCRGLWRYTLDGTWIKHEHGPHPLDIIEENNLKYRRSR